MRRRASSVTSHAAMIKLFQKHRNIKYLENGLHRHATHVFLKYTSTGGYAKNPIIDFAHQVAPETKFQIQHFGGVLQYTSRAIEAHDAAQAKRKTREAIARCTICDQNGFITIENEMKYSSMTKCPHDRERILRVAQERGWTILNLPSSSAS